MSSTLLAPSPSAALTVRHWSLVAGISLAAMAVAAPVAVFGLLPAGQTGLAALIVVVVALLDVVIGVALVPVLEPGGPVLARLSAALRVAYAAVFAVAGAFLLAPADVERFNAIWDAGLLLFAAHLAVVGVAALRASTVPSWVAWCILVAAAGYLIDAVIAVAGVAAPFQLATVAFVGELVFLVWLLARGGVAQRGEAGR